MAGLRQLLGGGPGSWRSSSSGSMQQSGEDEGVDATRQQLADLLHRRAANDLQVGDIWLFLGFGE